VPALQIDQEAPLSPCKRQCALDDTRSYCVTCMRTRDEIVEWRHMTNDQRRVIMNALSTRSLA
jgi:uncharacterized protein